MSRATYGQIQVTRGDIAALSRNAAREFAAKRDLLRRMDEVDGPAEERAESIAVLQRTVAPAGALEPYVEWEAINEPYRCKLPSVRGCLTDAQRNRWSIQELLTRRIRRALRDALEANKVASGRAAARIAMRTQVHVADLTL